jgi:hypothetical protein
MTKLSLHSLSQTTSASCQHLYHLLLLCNALTQQLHPPDYHVAGCLQQLQQAAFRLPVVGSIPAADAAI